jgi:hypothetical protein
MILILFMITLLLTPYQLFDLKAFPLIVLARLSDHHHLPPLQLMKQVILLVRVDVMLTLFPRLLNTANNLLPFVFVNGATLPIFPILLSPPRTPPNPYLTPLLLS